VPAALLAGVVARHLSRRGRGLVTAAVAAIVTTAVLPNLFWVV
jgi:hypothetical protein